MILYPAHVEAPDGRGAPAIQLRPTHPDSYPTVYPYLYDLPR